jgi:hypothetical protein
MILLWLDSAKESGLKNMYTAFAMIAGSNFSHSSYASFV